jgi:hypothetical protein
MKSMAHSWLARISRDSATPLAHQPLAPAPTYRQAFFGIQSINTLHVHWLTAAFQHRMQSTIAIARLLPGQLYQFLA